MPRGKACVKRPFFFERKKAQKKRNLPVSWPIKKTACVDGVMAVRAGKTMWLIDAAYLFNAQESVGAEYNFDYLKLRLYLEERGPIASAWYFNSTQNPPTDNQSGFHAWLQTPLPHGPGLNVCLYKLKFRDYECPFCQRKFTLQVQKGVDVGLATLIVRGADQEEYNTLILSSGDGDLKDALAHARNQCGKRIELCVFRWGVSPDLLSLADKIYWIDDFARQVAKKS